MLINNVIKQHKQYIHLNEYYSCTLSPVKSLIYSSLFHSHHAADMSHTDSSSSQQLYSLTVDIHSHRCNHTIIIAHHICCKNPLCIFLSNMSSHLSLDTLCMDEISRWHWWYCTWDFLHMVKMQKLTYMWKCMIIYIKLYVLRTKKSVLDGIDSNIPMLAFFKRSLLEP